MSDTSISSVGSNVHHRFTLSLIEADTSQANNTSTVWFYFRIAPVSSSWNWEQWGSSISYTININGTYYTGTIPNYDGYSNVLLKSGTLTVKHNDNGAKTISFGFEVTDNTGQSYTCGNAEGNGTLKLTTISRYLSITSLEITNKTETSVVVNWKVSHPRNSAYYSFDDGKTWIGSATDGETLATNNKSGSFNILNLTANTDYKLKVRMKRTDTGVFTYKDITFTTYNYPHCTVAPNFTIGNTVKLEFYNPLGRLLRWEIFAVNGSSIDNGNTTETSQEITFDKTSIGFLYESIPNAKSGTYAVKVTYGSNVNTKIGGRYSIKGTEVPTVGDITYEDVNAQTFFITENEQHIVQNESLVNISFADATPNYGAGSIKKYVITCNGITKEYTKSGGYLFGTINSSKNVSATLTVTDSRGLSNSKTIEMTVFAHSNPTALVTLERLNNYEDETYLTVDGSISSVNNKNTMTIKYRYKLQGGNYGSYVIIGDKVKQTLSLDKNNVYIFHICIVDAFGAEFNGEFTLNKGVFPLFIDTAKNSIGVNTFPKRVKSLEVKEGQIYLEREEENTDAIYMAKRIDTGHEIGFGVGKGGINRGVYDYFYEKWLLKADENGIYVNDIKIDENTFGDSGWITADLEGNFAHYNDAQTLQYRKVGKQVFISGAMKPIFELEKDTSHKAFTLPEGYRPKQLQDFLCQGSIANKWLCEITSAGVVSVARYGTTEFTAIPTTAWLPVHISFLVD